jgi:hypothetical protein
MVMPIPMVPIIMPTNMVTPSLFNSPRDMINIPQPGGKLVKGSGSDIDKAKTKEKMPIILSQVCALI